MYTLRLIFVFAMLFQLQVFAKESDPRLVAGSRHLDEYLLDDNPYKDYQDKSCERDFVQKVQTKEFIDRTDYLVKNPIRQYVGEPPWGAFEAKVKLVEDPTEAFLARIMMINRANVSIDMNYYIFNHQSRLIALSKGDDLAGQGVIKALANARRRGVNIRILFDSSGSIHFSHGFFKILYDVKPGINSLTGKPATIDIVSYGPLRLTRAVDLLIKKLLDAPVFLKKMIAGKKIKDEGFVTEAIKLVNRRNHDKILLIDKETERTMALIGGRNVAERYYKIRPEDKDIFNDMDLLVADLPTQQKVSLKKTIARHFQRTFCSLQSKRLYEHIINRHNKVVKFFTEIVERVDHGHGKVMTLPLVLEKYKNMIADNYLESGFEQTEVEFFNEIQNLSRNNPMTNPLAKYNPKNRKNFNSLIGNIHTHIGQAKRSIDIVTPYLYLTPNEKEAIKRWVSEDPNRRVRFLTNSAMTTDNPMAQALVDYDFAPAFMDPHFENYVEKRDKVQQKELKCHKAQLHRLNECYYDLTPNEFESLMSLEKSQYRFEEYKDQITVYTLGNTELGRDAIGKLHSKYLIIDDEKSIVMTSNLDPRSRYLNSEVGFLVHGERTTKMLLRNLEDLLEKSHVWGSDEWHEVRKAVDHDESGQELLYNLMRDFGLIQLI